MCILRHGKQDVKELAFLREGHSTRAVLHGYLEEDWTKNRKPGFQPLPAELVAELAELASGKDPDDPLLYVPSHPARDLDKGLEAAGIPKWTPEGKVDFLASCKA